MSFCERFFNFNDDEQLKMRYTDVFSFTVFSKRRSILISIVQSNLKLDSHCLFSHFTAHLSKKYICFLKESLSHHKTLSKPL